MNDDRTDRIRALQERISQWGRVHDREIQQERDAQLRLSDSLSLAFRIAVLGSLPAVGWLLCWALVTTADQSTWIQALTSIGTLFVFEVVTAGAARASGLLAHWWFCHSAARERAATIYIAFVADALLFLWVIVLARW